MTSSPIIEAVAIAAYAHGVSAVDLGEILVAILAEEVLGIPDRDPRAVLLGRRVVGALLDAQWAMPGGTETTPGGDRG